MKWIEDLDFGRFRTQGIVAVGVFIPMSTASFPPAAWLRTIPAGSFPPFASSCPSAYSAASSEASFASNSVNSTNRADSSSTPHSNNLPRPAYSAIPRELGHKDWVVYAKPPFGDAEHVLNYLGPLHPSRRHLQPSPRGFRNDRVSFRWRDYAHGGKKKVMTVSAHEFLRRFMLHVLPGGLVHIRHFGLFANRRRSTSLQRCRSLIGIAACVDLPQPPSLRCPACSGAMLVVERLTCGQLYFRACMTPAKPRRCDNDSS